LQKEEIGFNEETGIEDESIAVEVQ